MASSVPCIVCGKPIPLANLELYYHVMAHKADGIVIRWGKVVL